MCWIEPSPHTRHCMPMSEVPSRGEPTNSSMKTEYRAFSATTATASSAAMTSMAEHLSTVRQDTRHSDRTCRSRKAPFAIFVGLFACLENLKDSNATRLLPLHIDPVEVPAIRHSHMRQICERAGAELEHGLLIVCWPAVEREEMSRCRERRMYLCARL